MSAAAAGDDAGLDAAELTAELLRECRTAAAAAAAELDTQAKEVALLRSAWPLRFLQLLTRDGASERATAVQRAALEAAAEQHADSGEPQPSEAEPEQLITVRERGAVLCSCVRM
jgi:hypothetical protein